MADAQCAFGALRLTLREPAKLVAICHCLAFQRRTGTSFSVNAFYAIDAVEVLGSAKEFIRVAESGRNVRMYFCPDCGFDDLLETGCCAHNDWRRCRRIG